jgi:hypothetical protein
MLRLLPTDLTDSKSGADTAGVFDANQYTEAAEETQRAQRSYGHEVLVISISVTSVPPL